MDGLNVSDLPVPKDNPLPNVIRDRNNRERFTCVQRYMLNINSRKDKSVSCIKIVVPEGTLTQNFYFAFRRWLKSNKVPVVQYCYEAQLEEFLCVDLAEPKLQK